MDENSKRIMRALQADATLSAKDLAERLSMSQTTVWRRVQDLEVGGYITGRVAVLDPGRLGLDVCVQIAVNLKSQDADTRRSFEQFVSREPRITQCFSVTGAQDYMLIAYAPTIKEFEGFLMNALLAHPSVNQSNASLVLNRIKDTTALPV